MGLVEHLGILLRWLSLPQNTMLRFKKPLKCVGGGDVAGLVAETNLSTILPTKKSKNIPVIPTKF